MENLLLNRAERLVVRQWTPYLWFTPYPLMCGSLHLGLCILPSSSFSYLYWALQISFLASPLPQDLQDHLNGGEVPSPHLCSSPKTLSGWHYLGCLPSPGTELPVAASHAGVGPSSGALMLSVPRSQPQSGYRQSALPCVQCRQG